MKKPGNTKVRREQGLRSGPEFIAKERHSAVTVILFPGPSGGVNDALAAQPVVAEFDKG